MAKRKKEKQQDETIIDIVETRDNLQDYFNKNAKLIIGVIAAIFIVVAGYFIYKYLIIAPKEGAAVEQMYKAQEQFARDSFALALENPGSGYEGFIDIIDSYSGTKAANSAKYYAGVSYLNLGRYEDAVSYLSDVKPKGEVLSVMKFGTLGDAYSELNEMGKAKSAYKKAVSAEGNDFLTPYYIQKLALLNMSEGNNAEAQKLFSQIKNEYPTSQFATEVDKFITK